MEQLTYAPMYLSKALTANARTVEAVLSSETIDGHGEIVDQASWRLERYRKNPIVLFMHDPMAPIGHAKSVRVADGTLQAEIEFATTSQAAMVAKLFADGALRAFSVGFRVGAVSEEIVNGTRVRRLMSPELMEVSAVSIPSNPDAVVKMKSLGLVPASFEFNASRALLAELEHRAGLTDEQRNAEDVASALRACGIETLPTEVRTYRSATRADRGPSAEIAELATRLADDALARGAFE